MKKDIKTIKSRTFEISQNPELRRITLCTHVEFTDESVLDECQDFNLSVVPFEMAMSVICSIINPQSK